jgi:drug/metabolite transporter (DMT)-like permease
MPSGKKLGEGILLILSAELLFTAASAFAKYATLHSQMTGVQVTFFRFLLGFIVTAFFIRKQKLSIKPNNVRLVVQRGVFNTLAVVLFFAGINYTTVTNANMLNMTYPVFVFLLAPFINKERSPGIYYLFLASAMAGVYLVAFPDFSSVNIGDLLSLASGIMAGFGITSLRQAAKFDNTHIILFYLMGIGTVLNAAIMAPVFTFRGSALVWTVVAFSAAAGYGGQVLLTKGYRHISAAGGSLVSSSRILWAMLMGSIFFADKITPRIAAGSVCIVLSLVMLSGVFDRYFRKMKRNTAPRDRGD